VYFAMDSIFKWFEELFDRLGYAYENAAFGANYIAFLETPERGRGQAHIPRDRGIELRGVSFRYPGASENAIDSVTLSLKPGEAVAIVGENGAGKSSLVRLMAGLYRPDSGTISAGGVDLCEAADAARFQGLSAVFQQYQRYRMTLFDNVRVAEPAAVDCGEPTQRELVTPGGSRTLQAEAPGAPGLYERTRAGQALQLAGFYERTGQTAGPGLDSMLSREFGGVDLSGGEWQRVAIARGLYRPYDTIILDEPTAAIDPLEEDRVYRMFLESARGKTAIIVTHRLGLARFADRILVMERGRIVQDGAHADLIASPGLYAQMFQAQAAWYEREAETA
jgi:ATP-binding cassette subfamily B protein